MIKNNGSHVTKHKKGKNRTKRGTRAAIPEAVCPCRFFAQPAGLL
jgi:hypothetical protein